MVLTSKFGQGSVSSGGSGGVLFASLNEMVAPSQDTRAALVQAYATEKPGHMAGLQDYFAQHALAKEEAPGAGVTVRSSKPGTNLKG